MRVNSVVGGTPRTVTITNTTLTGFQRSGLFANGPSTVHVSGSTIGPADALPAGLNAQNAVQIGSGNAGGTFTGNTVVGRGFGACWCRVDGDAAGHCLEPHHQQQHDHGRGYRHRHRR